MCEKAEEIQKQSGMVNAFSWCGEKKAAFLWEGNNIYFCSDKNVWLPRQDQLQEMCINGLWKLNFAFTKFLFDSDKFGYCDFHIRRENTDFTSMRAYILDNSKCDRIEHGGQVCAP